MFGKKKKEDKKTVAKETKSVEVKKTTKTPAKKASETEVKKTTAKEPAKKTTKAELKQTVKKAEPKKATKPVEKKAPAKKVEEKKVENTGIYRVVYDKTDRLWKIKKDGAKRVIASMPTKEEALARVKDLSETKEVGYVVHKKDGKFQKK
ncbi:MAG: DUF2188 domain-containing protein [Clostridia bacterium]|nr:DUF2188 domain-containing protein [Clostridia bacterium]